MVALHAVPEAIQGHLQDPLNGVLTSILSSHLTALQSDQVRQKKQQVL